MAKGGLDQVYGRATLEGVGGVRVSKPVWRRVLVETSRGGGGVDQAAYLRGGEKAAPGPRGEHPRIGGASSRMDVHLWARNKTMDDLVTEASARLRLPQAATVAELLERVKARTSLTLVLDALDEAAIGQRELILRELVQPLSRLARVLVGTRNSPVHVDSGVSSGLLDLLPEGANIIDLRDEPDTQADIATYVRRRLMALPTWASRPRDVQEAASEVARVASTDTGGFLLARVITGRLRRVPPTGKDWRAQLQLGITEALEDDLASGTQLYREGTVVPDAPRELMAALAFAEGAGLPAREVWERVASAVSPVNSYGEKDVEWLLGEQGSRIVRCRRWTQTLSDSPPPSQKASCN